jgi:hypothetical protein
MQRSVCRTVSYMKYVIIEVLKPLAAVYCIGQSIGLYEKLYLLGHNAM